MVYVQLGQHMQWDYYLRMCTNSGSNGLSGFKDNYPQLTCVMLQGHNIELLNNFNCLIIGCLEDILLPPLFTYFIVLFSIPELTHINPTGHLFFLSILFYYRYDN